MEELTDNAEEPDEAESKQSEVKLGRLQYKVCVLFILFKRVLFQQFSTLLFLSVLTTGPDKNSFHYLDYLHYFQRCTA